MATEGRSLRSGRTLPDPSDPLEPMLVEGESDEGGSQKESEEEDGELWVDNERYDIIITSLCSFITHATYCWQANKQF